MQNDSNAEQTNGNKYVQNFTLLPEKMTYFSRIWHVRDSHWKKKPFYISRKWVQAWYTLWWGGGEWEWGGGGGGGGGGWGGGVMMDGGELGVGGWVQGHLKQRYISFTNGALWDVVLVHCGICELGNFVVVGGNRNCHNDNMQCHQWRQSWQHDNSIVFGEW